MYPSQRCFVALLVICGAACSYVLPHHAAVNPTAPAIGATPVEPPALESEAVGPVPPSASAKTIVRHLAPPSPDFAATPAPRPSGAYGDLPLAFEENRGQTGAQVKYLARGKGYTLFLTPKEAVLSLRYNDPAQAGPDEPDSPASLPLSPRARAPKWSYSALKLEFVGAKHARLQGIEKLDGISNYFIGGDPSQWHTAIPNYRKVVYRNAYPGIDLAYYGNPGMLETDFVVKPGGSPRAIQVRLKGASESRLDDSGDLVLSTKAGDVRLHKPVAYQETSGARREIAANYRLRGKNTITFSVGTYDPDQPLIIDPTLSYSTYLGGSNTDQASGIAVDSAGEAYTTGSTSSPNFPTQVPLQGAPGATGAENVFVSKFAANGTSLVFSTYLGGSGPDRGLAIALDSSGNAFIGGLTNSSNFPGTANSTIQSTRPNSGQTGFVSKISANGATLLFSTYLGGNGTDAVGGMAVDSNSDAYAAGATTSTNFPSVAAFQPAIAGVENAFVTKIKGNGSVIVYSSYLGGEAFDEAHAIAVDSAGNAYLTGNTRSGKFNTKIPIQANLGAPGATNAFVAEVSFTATGPAPASSLVYSTYLGGSRFDVGFGIAVDASGNAYVTGQAQSPDFPLKNPLQAPDNGGDPFVAKVATGGTSLDFSTPFGGGNDSASAIALDSANPPNIYIAGPTRASTFPTRVPLQAVLPSINFISSAAFVAELKNDGSDYVFATYLSGSNSPSFIGDTASGIAADINGNVYVTGFTSTLDFPTVAPFQANLFQGAPNASSLVNAFVAKIAPATPAGTQMYPPALTFGSVAQSSSATEVVTLAAGTNPLIVNSVTIGGANPGDFKEFDTCGPATVPPQVTCTLFVTLTPSAVGIRSATVTINEASGMLSFNASGTGTPAPTTPPNGTVTLSPGTLNFGNQEETVQSAAQTFSVTVSVNPVTLQFAAAFTGDTGDFAPATAATSPCPFGTPIAVGAPPCNIAVVFDPLQTGPRSAGLGVFGNLTTNPTTITVNGTGTAAPTLTPSNVSFPNTVVGQMSAAMTVTLTNTVVGGPALTGITPMLTGPFVMTGTTCPGPAGGLTGGNSCTFSIAFAPPLNSPLLGVGGTFSVTDSDPAPLFVSLSGVALNATATLDVFPPATLLFGRVPVGTSSNASVFLANTGNTNMTVTPSTSGAAAGVFTPVNNCPSPDPPAQECTIGVTFTPPSAGPFFGTLTINGTNAASPGGPATNSPQNVSISGTGVAATTSKLSPNPLIFPATPMGTPSQVEYAFLSNTGTSIDYLKAVSTTGAFMKDFNPNTSGNAPFSAQCFPDPVNPQGVCVIGITFTPSTTGLETATLQVTDTATGTPQTITLQGGQAAGPPVVQLSTGTLTFSAQVIQTTSTEQTLTVTNTGASNLTFTGITPSGDFQCFATGFQMCAIPNQVTANPACSTVTPLAPNASCDIGVTFTPTATGTRNGMLSIADNAANSPQTVTLTGLGVSGQLTVTPAMINFPVQIVNTTSASMPVTVSNGTTFNQSVLLPIVTPAGFGETDNCTSNGAPVPIPPNGTCTINVTFTPTSATQFQGNLQLLIQQGLGSPSPTPFSVALTGMGSNATFTLAIAPGFSSTVTTTPGGSATTSILVTGTMGIPQTINLSASTTSNTISTAVSPSSVKLTGAGNQQVAAVLETFCRGTGNLPPSPLRRIPPWGIGLLLAALAITALAFTYRRPPRWAFALALLMLIAIGGGACGGDPGVNGPTPPGTYPVTLTATSGQQVQTLNITLVVKP